MFEMDWIQSPSKAYKSAFMTGFKGASVKEIYFISMLMPMYLWLDSLIVNTFKLEDKWSPSMRFGLDSVVILLPVLISLTLPDEILKLYILWTALTGGLLLYRKKYPQKPKSDDGKPTDFKMSTIEKYQSISSCRFTSLLLTCIMILAIDFPLTPRRFCKADRFGTGLMDLGTGCFIVTGGVVAGIREDRANKSKKLNYMNFFTLLALGFGRLCFLSFSDYSYSYTEYGVHWNFFFTLAMMMVGSQFIKLDAISFLSIAVTFELALRLGGIQEWVLYKPRGHGLIEANKEGIVSLCGYFAIYAAGGVLGKLQKGSTSLLREWIFTILLMICSCISADNVSRRVANGAYSVWVISVCQLGIAVAKTLTSVADVRRSPSFIMQKLNRCQLQTFLVANILTGICNMTMNRIYDRGTQACPNNLAFFLLFLYINVVGALSIKLFS